MWSLGALPPSVALDPLRLSDVAALSLPTEDVEALEDCRPPGMAAWREKLFALLSRNALRATTLFSIPADRVFELGVQAEL
jgi:K+ transporter